MARSLLEVLTIVLVQLAIVDCALEPWKGNNVSLSQGDSKDAGKVDEGAHNDMGSPDIKKEDQDGSFDTVNNSGEDVVDDGSSGSLGSKYDDLKGEETMITFINLMDHDVKIYWNHGHGDDTGDFDDGHHIVEVGTVPIGAYEEIVTRVGHRLQYAEKGEIHSIRVPQMDESRHLQILIGPKEFRIRCSTTEGPLHMNILPHWSPHGAARFIHLMLVGYYEGCAINRVIPGLLTQFGIGPDYESRTTLALPSHSISDDQKRTDLQFQPGYISYTGSGPHSRSNEIFIVMPNTPESQLENFGKNPWETPFGFVDEHDLNNVVSKWNSEYGDGIDRQRIYQEDGYEYLQKEYPNLSYIKQCDFLQVADEKQEEEPDL